MISVADVRPPTAGDVCYQTAVGIMTTCNGEYVQDESACWVASIRDVPGCLRNFGRSTKRVNASAKRWDCSSMMGSQRHSSTSS